MSIFKNFWKTAWNDVSQSPQAVSASWKLPNKTLTELKTTYLARDNDSTFAMCTNLTATTFGPVWSFNGQWFSQGVSVSIDPVAATSVAITPKPVSLKSGATQQLTATVLPAGAIQTGTWTSGNPLVATVTPTGLVKGVLIGGTTTIAFVGVNGVTDSVAITVTLL